MLFEKLEKYAELIIKSGINLQKGEYVYISSPLEACDFARVLQKTAFKLGAKDVIVAFSDDELFKNRMIYTSEEVLAEDIKGFRLNERVDAILNKKATLISITSPTPGVLLGIDAKKMSSYLKKIGEVTKECKKKQMSNVNKWCVCAYANELWAKQVFPDLEVSVAKDKLQEIIYKCCLIDDTNDAIKLHTVRNKELRDVSKFLNQSKFKSLCFKTNLGTDLEVGLPKGYIFAGGSEESTSGIEFKANIPTEEVFTAPHRLMVNGRVVASKPLNYQGQIIEGIDLTFQDGKVVKSDASKNKEVLFSLLKQDEGSSYLGEVALVPHSSPISQTNVLFYNTLFDENASCHLALGMAYPSSIENGSNMSTEELEQNGLNISTVHVDFMFGTSDLCLEGIKEDGSRQLLMKNGEFCFEK